MVKILDLDHQMSNADVLNWVENKRAQHKREDEEDQAAGITLPIRPANFMTMLDKTERHLTSDAYPYAKNPSAYKDDNRNTSLHAFGDLRFERIQQPIFEKYKDAIRKGLMNKAEAKEQMGAEQEPKELTEPELLMIHNHAPKTVEMLEPMIEEVEERFTKEELQIIVDCICEVYRADEVKASQEKKMKAEKEGKDEGAQDTEMGDANREISPFYARPLPESGLVVDYNDMPGRTLFGPRSSGANAEDLGRKNRVEEIRGKKK